MEKSAAQLVVQTEAATLYDFLKDYIGTVASSEHTSGGAQMATDSGKNFAEGMVQKQREGKL